MGLVTLFAPQHPQGFFIPHRFAAASQRRAAQLFYPRIDEIFQQNQELFLRLLEEAEAFETEFQSIGSKPPPQPRWDQNWFTGLDAIAAYTLVRTRKPGRLVEVGAGHSTRFFAKAISDSGGTTRHVVIDPEPRASLAGLAIHHEAKLVTDVPEAAWTSLQAGDMVSIDSSHILMPGTDVDHLLNDVLPILPSGVIVHFHDMFLPDPYPEAWQWRGYNEQTAVAGLITGGAYTVVFSSHFVATRYANRIEKSAIGPFAAYAGAPPSSLWLRKA